MAQFQKGAIVVTVNADAVDPDANDTIDATSGKYSLVVIRKDGKIESVMGELEKNIDKTVTIPATQNPEDIAEIQVRAAFSDNHRCQGVTAKVIDVSKEKQ